MVKFLKSKEKPPVIKLFNYDTELTTEACQIFFQEFSSLSWEEQNNFIKLFENFILVISHLVFERSDKIEISPNWQILNDEGQIYLSYIEKEGIQIFDLANISEIAKNQHHIKFVFQTFIIEIKNDCVIIDNVLTNGRDVFKINRQGLDWIKQIEASIQNLKQEF